jgi:virulence factor Mce-like protein
MMKRRGQASVVANPALVGAVTVLVVLVAVYLAYNANNGLPFVPTRELKVDLPNGNELVKGDEVREGGFRVGLVSAMKPIRLPSGQVVAQATLKLDRSAGAYPQDTTVTVRPRTALGLEYVDIERGSSKQLVPDGATLPVTQANSEVEFDQVINTFDAPTRAASQTNLQEFGDATAARGPDINTSIAGLPRTLGALAPVAANLADPRTQLSNFFTQLDLTAQTLAPVSPTLAHLFTTMSDTFGAIDRSPAALQATISQTPGTLAVGTRSLAVQTPFLADFAALGSDLSPALAALHDALPTVNSALSTGIRVTRRTPVLYSNLQGSMGALRDLATTPTTNAALRGLTATVSSLQPQLRFLGPYVTVCNDWNYWWTFVGNSQTSPTPEGYALRALLNLGNTGQPDDVASEPAALPAHGGTGIGTPTDLHVGGSVYGTAITPGGYADCSYGQNGYMQKAIPAGVPSQYQGYNIVYSAGGLPVPYRVGSTFNHLGADGKGVGRGPDRVPAGETYTSEPGGIAAPNNGTTQHPDNLPTLDPSVTP